MTGARKDTADFWSRRKARVAQEAQEEAAVETRRKAAQAEADLAARPDEEILEELGLPDPDTLGPGDDVRRFMEAAVPERSRRRALRQLWRSNPALANLDALVDYGEDFTDAARVVADLQTAYEVGKGIAHRVAAAVEPAEEAAEASREQPDAAAAPVDRPQDVAEAPRTDPPATFVVRDNSADGGADGNHDIQESETWPATPRRMRFAFRTGGQRGLT